jgi:DUF4097 and DUF4098 domain-containing protein YvlB
MKNRILRVLLILVLGTQCINSQKNEFREEIKKEISFEKSNTNNLVVIQNLNGSIFVEGYDGDKIQLQIEKIVSAETAKYLELGKKEIGLKVIKQGDEVIIYPDIPHMEYKNGHLSSINYKDYKEPPYDHRMNFTVKIPRNIKLHVGTINNGEVVVRDTQGDFIKANNINGGIALENVTGQTEVSAINGEVNISYVANPEASSKYYALNGDINISYQKGLSAEIAFKSMNGELYTDFDVAGQYARTSRQETGHKKGKYKYESRPVVRIGNGGLFHDFETLNGNVIFTKI